MHFPIIEIFLSFSGDVEYIECSKNIMMRNNSEDYHKTHPTQLTDHLWLSAVKAINSKLLLDLKITSIINATLELPTMAYQKQEAIQIAVEDRIASKLYIYFDLVADKIQQVHLNGGRILVYCRAGQSRSATLCIAYFMKYHGMNYEDAFQFVRSRRPIIHPNIGFVRQLKEFEQKCKLKESVTSLAIGCTPALHRKTEQSPVASYPLPLSATESFATDESIVFENNELEAIVLGPPCLDLALVTVHDHYKEVAEKYDVDVVNSCDKFSTGAVQSPPEVPNIELHEPKPVAETSQQSTGENTGVWDPSSRRSKRRSAFTRLSKPNEIAVSYINLTLDLQHISNKITPFKFHITNNEYCTSEFTELHQAYEVYEEIPVVCLGQVAVLGHSAHRSSGPVMTHSILSKPHMCATSSFVVALFDVDTSVASENKNLVKQSARTVSKNFSFRGQKNLLEKSQNLNYPAFLRLNSTTVKSVDSSTKSARANRKVCDELLLYATHCLPNCCWESCQKFKKNTMPSKLLKKKAKTIIQARSAVISTEVYLLDSKETIEATDKPTVDVYHKLDFSIANFNNCWIASSFITCILGDAQLQLGKGMRVSKQYPYYSKVTLTSAVDMLRATEGAKLKTQWFQMPEQKKLNNAVKLERKVSDSRKEKPIRKLSTLNWGTENWIQNDFSYSFDMADHVWREEYVDISPGNRLCVHFHETETYHLCKNDLIGRFYVPQYNSVLLKKDSGAVFYEVALIWQPTALEQHNIYSNPRTKLMEVKARQNVHSEYKTVCSHSIINANNDEERLEVIPDEIHDLNYLKEFLSSSSSSKCNIWLDVFKRTLIKLKPTRASIVYVDPLQAPEISSNDILDNAIFVMQVKSEKKEYAKLGEVFANQFNIALCCSNITVIHQCSEFNRFSQKKISPKRFHHQLSVADTCLVEFNPVVWDVVPNFHGSCSKSYQEHATSSVAFPNKLYSVSHIHVLGTTAQFSKSNEYRRTAFQIVSKLHSVASHQLSTHLTCSGTLPSYQFVQDVEDWPDQLVHKENITTRANVNEIHVLWFFAMDPKLDVDEKPSNYLLFLPDPETATLIGQEDIDGNKEDAIINPNTIINEVLHEINDTSIVPDAPEKHVTFTEQELVSKPKQKVKTIYYGRDRSKSRQRLKDVHATRTRKRSPSRHNEQEILDNLKKSVSEANGILSKRRDPGRYSDYPGTPALPRGRQTSRRAKSSAESYDVSSRIMSPASYKREFDVSQESSHQQQRMGSRQGNTYQTGGNGSSSGGGGRRVQSESYDRNSRYKSPEPYDSPASSAGGDSMLLGIMSMAQSMFSRGPTRRETTADQPSTRFSTRPPRKYN